jgi:hypothetical protein
MIALSQEKTLSYYERSLEVQTQAHLLSIFFVVLATTARLNQLLKPRISIFVSGLSEVHRGREH